MKVWIDMTNSPHVPFFRPLIRLLEEHGHDVSVSARDFAQTLELLDAAGIGHEVVGPPHGGAGRSGKVRAMDDVYAWEQTLSQGLLLSVEHSTLGSVSLPGSPLRFDDNAFSGGRSSHQAPPTLGQHNESIREWLEAPES